MTAARIGASLVLGLAAQMAQGLDVVVRDALSGHPVANATVVVWPDEFRSDDQGRLAIPAAADGTRIDARAPGYARFRGAAGPAPLVITLQPLRPKALYLSAYGIGSAKLRGDALRLVAETELNALVIDVKGDRGIVPYPSAALAAAGVAQSVVTVRDMPALMESLRAQGLYLIARIVTFKDDPYAEAHPAWAVHDARGNVWKDREGLAWIDPFRREAWEHNLALADEAAALGFDEIQFDYLRFPDATGLAFAEPDTEDRRIVAIGAFLDAARHRLARHNVFIAADVFGYVTWNRDDTHIGQRLESIIAHVDYLSPMLYPSGFTFGIPGYRDPVAAPYEIVYRSLQRALERTGLPATRLRPWLQAFRDYAFDRRMFGEREIRLQIEAAESLGTDGWMLWNAGNRYQEGGLDREQPARP
ncbi:putative glycoside hydrolase [Roseateles sp.]|uniref:putative glycoside hydrolase n=1 Tax=Roseateles sp. TaxID=1971397 RepID=UPI0025E8B559|nr:putative glycoside hydrolase [Roseateles sp.]MBV8036874.1 GTP-binding protein [Roseateles sp.]